MAIEYCNFDTKQAEYFRRTKDCWLNVAEGGKRAGKNILNILAFADNLETHPDKIHLAFGVTKATAKMNIMDSNGYGLEHYFKGRCRSGTYNDVDCLYVTTKTGVKIVLYVGGKDSDDYRKIKGFSLGSVYGTEANECHKTFVMEAMDRTLASKDRKIFFDLNPKPPRHWFYDEFLDFQDELAAQGKNPRYNYAHFTIWNNLSITNAQLREALSKYDKTSLWYQADILGKRTAATGRIYTGWNQDCIVDRDRIANPKRPDHLSIRYFSLGVDIGGTDATVCTLTGYTFNYKDTVLLDGYYHKQGKAEGMDHSMYARQICDSIEEWIAVYPKVAAAPIFCESADKLFRQALKNELKKRGLTRMQIVPAYKKDGIVDRIRLGNILINQGRFYVMRHMKPWIEAYENAMWDDEEYEKGEWERIDDGSYPVDCLDSAEYSIQPYKESLLKGGNI